MNRRDRRARLDDIAHVGETLRSAPIEAPDLMASILDRVDVERPFLAPSVRRKLPWIRIGAGSCVALCALSVALLHRYAPRAVQFTETPAPVSDVVQCVECAANAKYTIYRPAVLNVTEQDCSNVLAAMAAAADIAQNEGRRPIIGSDAPITLTAILPLSQAVGLDTPAPPTNLPMVASVRSSPRLRSPLTHSQSVLPEGAAGGSGGGMGPVLLMAGEPPRVRVVPTFLEHDLDGFVFPR